MMDRNEVITEIQELLGSTGTRALAERLFPLLKKHGYVTFNNRDGFVLKGVPSCYTLVEILREKEMNVQHA